MKPIQLICTPLRFYARYDEDAFFWWLKQIPCIEKFEGIGRELHLYVPTKEISDTHLRNLRGVFKRYNFDRTQLRVFMTEANQRIFDNE